MSERSIRLWGLLAGSAAAGLVWAALEVLWLEIQPMLPAVAQHGGMTAPEDLWALVGSAFATYLPLGILTGLASLPFAARWLGRTSPAGAFALGVFAGAAVLASLGVVVWINLLVGLPPLSPTALAAYLGGALPVVAIAAGGALLLARVSPARGLLLLVLLATAALVGARWAHGPSATPLPARGAADPSLPNILFVTIDTLRADHLGAYGGRFQTPVFDRIAAEGLLFTQVVSQVPHTTPSHVSIFTSVYPADHGAAQGRPMQTDHPTLPAHLRSLGYHTAAFVSAFTAKSSVTGLGPSFDVYVDSLNPWLPFLSHDALEPLVFWRLVGRLSWGQIQAPDVNRRVVGWLEDGPPQPFFLWVHYFDAHAPFPPLPRYEAVLDFSTDPDLWEQLEALYGLAVEYTDEQLGVLLRELDARGLLDETIVVITSDHGEALGEPHPSGGRPAPDGSGMRSVGHGNYLYDSVLLIPLAIRAPGRLEPGVVDALVESIDIGPILLEVLGREAPASFKGRSLQRVVRDRSEGREPIAFSQTTGAFRQDSGFVRHLWFSARSPRWKLLIDASEGREELFDLEADPGERRDLREEQPEVARRLRERLNAAMPLEALAVDPEQLDAETLRKLQALGYLLDGE